MTSRYPSVILFGAPGVGKGTQGALLGRIPGFHHVATGDIFRALDRDSEFGRIFHEYSSRGALVPDELTVRIWRHEMDRRIDAGLFNPADMLLVLDGIPRNPAQVAMLADDLEVLRIVHLSCPDDEEIVRRIQKRSARLNRDDDARAEVIRHRLTVYRNETRPVLEALGRSLVSDVDCLGSPARVLRDILDILVPIHEARFNNILNR